ncbi:uncharacterized protein AMSG_11676 [Thecamonas trahens ATCC 50062]|uniref:EamA domain-containing protein n=1 Tax=Thecamonas trahens ATCC 50062 TaxID=461836 RepID=A0A0L0DTM5_THETB|nr:hypothetical protein AMSG_11676 [Thecamonas trahens ATCC 50062]KNC55679.1 hypothetical protein AMSG_11676 [Thecamonas trahens ATCC 50062]|eukprot:XP_013761482.1 hypothetical protein AMSG_11676 [Thecamonas trahens ATCC 50062]
MTSKIVSTSVAVALGPTAPFTVIHFLYLGYGIVCVVVTSALAVVMLTVADPSPERPLAYASHSSMDGVDDKGAGSVWQAFGRGARNAWRSASSEVARVGWAYHGVLVLSALFNAIGTLTLTLAFDADQSAKGAVLAVASVAGVLVSLLSWAFFGEKLLALQWVFLVVATAGVVVISLDAGLGGTFTPIAFAFCTLLMFSGANLAIEFGAVRRNINWAHANVVYELTHGVLGVVVVAIQAARGAATTDLTAAQVAMATAAGALLASGVFLVNVGISVGHAGIVTAIANGSAALTVLLDLTVGIEPSWLELVGIAITLTGVCGLSWAASGKREPSRAAFDITSWSTTEYETTDDGSALTTDSS